MSLWMLSMAWAGGVFINDIQVDPSSIANVELERVTVRFDDDGNVRITAPGYDVKVLDPERAPEDTVETAVETSRSSATVEPARYWLVTEDRASSGHRIECRVNGELAAVVRSGETQRILDVGRWLRPGANVISLRATSARSRSGGDSGTLYVYVGTGRADETGTVLMDDPAVQFGLDSRREGETQREYTLTVD